MTKLLFLFILFALFFSGLNAQNIENWISANEKNPVEKIYIQTDAENYFTGDTVWFKVFLTDSRSGKLIPGAENIYVNVLDENGKSVVQMMLLCIDGQASGRFTISDAIRSGNFLMYAYTNYLFNFGPNSYFYKQLTISKVTSVSGNYVLSHPLGNMVADVRFYPEGEVLLENATNLVAFKAKDKSGFGVNVHGVVKDDKGLVVASFTTDYQGMGLFFLTPESGKTYTATIDGFPSFKYKFTPAESGIKIQLVNHTSQEVIVNIAGNSENYSGETFYLVDMYRGQVLFYQSFKMEGINKVFKIESKLLKPGINKLILLDKTFNPVSERYLFSRNFDLNNLNVSTDSSIYHQLSEVKLRIADKYYLGEKEFSDLSVSVIHEAVLPENGFSKNILSQILIDSELNEFVESSVQFFSDTDISSDAKLRLLMLSCNKENYFWDNVPVTSKPLKYKQEFGIDLNGKAENALTGNVISNGDITLVIQKNDEIAFLTQETDSVGGFNFKGLMFNDTANVHIQLKSETGKMNTDTEIEPVFKSAPFAESQLKPLKEKSLNKSELSALKYRIYNEKRKSQPKVKRKYDRDNGKNITDDGYFRIYESADYVLKVNPNEQSYSNILDYMVGKIPGVDISGDNVNIRGASNLQGNTLPLFLIDGVPLVNSQMINLPPEVTQNINTEGETSSNSQLIQTIKSIPLSDVEQIEILKSAQNTSTFGVKGANGVIAIFTRRGKLGQGSSTGKGIMEKKIVGYSGYESFYSPNYSEQDIKSQQADLRILLFWNPEVKSENGEAEIKFFTSGLTGKYIIIVEGISSEGKIRLGLAEFEVK